MDILYFDHATKTCKERAFTPAELAQRAADIAAAATPVVPASIPMLNAHLVLIDAGWMPAIRDYINSIPANEGESARAYFDKALTMRRNHPLVKGIPAAIGKTEAEVDALFIAAAAMG